MPHYVIARGFDVGEPEMPGVGRRSSEIAENGLPEITWDPQPSCVDDTGKVRKWAAQGMPVQKTEGQRRLAMRRIAAGLGFEPRGRLHAQRFSRQR